MCLYIVGGLRIAEEDIVCYKVLDVYSTTLRSPYYDKCVWKVGEVKTATMGLDRDGETVREGLHTFETLEDAIDDKNEWGSKDVKVFEAIIPKGATYYMGANNDDRSNYTSDQLIIKKLVY